MHMNHLSLRRLSITLAASGACAASLAGCGGSATTEFTSGVTRADPNTKNVTVQINGVTVPVTRRMGSDSWKFVIARANLSKNGPIAWKLPECAGVAKTDIAGVVQFYKSAKGAPRFELMAG